MSFILSLSTQVKVNETCPPLKKALGILRRDMNAVLTGCGRENRIILSQDDALPPQRWQMTVADDALTIRHADALGGVYALLHISEHALGVKPLWFWNDQPLPKTAQAEIPCGEHVSPDFAVKYRGWFINDEVLLDAWYLDGSKDKPWEMAFEALLRLGGNLVIPGTDRNAHIYDKLAAEYGLYITHHHAEPLGARMVLRAYPDLNPSYDEHPDLFEGLWQEAVDKQKFRPTVYNLGFRGQGDCPFWADDPRYDTPEARGALMSELIRKQYDLVKANIPDAPCCTNLYGETMELYQQGHLDLPEDVIKIWADNGFGKMVTRRQGNHNPRIRALPKAGAAGAHG